MKNLEKVQTINKQQWAAAELVVAVHHSEKWQINQTFL